jgi:hypothetical protein
MDTTNYLEAAFRNIFLQATWLADHCRMVGALQLRCPTTPNGAAEAAMHMALRPPLQLQSLQLRTQRRAAELLQQLDPSHLTRLYLHTYSAEQQVMASPLLAGVLGRLTRLQDLTVTASWHAMHSSMASTLAGMPHLTRLVLQPQLPAAALAQLPSQLVELQLANPICNAEQLITHITALWQLQSLALVYNNDIVPRQDIVEHAAAWAALPMLRRLDFEVWSGDEDNSLSAGIAAGIAGATSLTRLYCWFFGGKDGDADLLAMLATLKQLQGLEINMEWSVAAPIQFEIRTAAVGQPFRFEAARAFSWKPAAGSAVSALPRGAAANAACVR